MTGVFTLGNSDHFVPEADLDPRVQMKLKAALEHIDYTAFAANREVIGKGVGALDHEKFQRVAVAAAEARVRYVHKALAITTGGHQPSAAEINDLAGLRLAFEELFAAFEAMRRIVERGYVPIHN
jgi:hypothetical protein